MLNIAVEIDVEVDVEGNRLLLKRVVPTNQFQTNEKQK
jgi:hypothetical protein